MSLTYTKPYSDDDMIWDEEKRQYRLTKKYTLTKLNHNTDEWAGSKEEGTIALEENSDDVYFFIYSYTQQPYIKTVEYILGATEEFRNVIKRSLLAQYRYMVRSGGDLLKSQHGVNIEKGFNIGLSNMSGDVEVGRHVKKILSQSGILYGGLMTITGNIEDDWYIEDDTV